MTYVSKGEKIFAFRDRFLPDCTKPTIKRSDGRLKKFSSVLDGRSWSIDEYKRYRYLYDLTSGSQTCLSSSSCFKYVPLDDLFNLLLADRDAYIKCLEKELRLRGDVKETPVNEIFKANKFEDDEESEAVSLRKKIQRLNAELEERKNAQDLLGQAMLKLENIDEIVNENKCLKARLRCSEDMIKDLEERKGKLEKELQNLRTKSQIQMDLEAAQETLKDISQKTAKRGNIDQLAQERDTLQQRIRELQSELEAAKSKQSELELITKQSESTIISLEEVMRENECYKKKLAAMKCLEIQIDDLKNQASVLVEKYKRDVAKSSEQDKQMRDICEELGSLREERDKLKKRVDELALYECQYISLQCKLKQVDSILAENDKLNCKLASLDKLEMENRILRCKLEQCQASEQEAEESKEKIRKLQNAVADQEKEMEDLLHQIEMLTGAYTDSNELALLKKELCQKDCKLKLCEEQLAEIRLLEDEIDELRSKLENRYSDINKADRKPIIKTAPDESSVEKVEDVRALETNDEEYTDFDEGVKPFEAEKPKKTLLPEKKDYEKDSMTCEEVQNLLQSSKGIITCVLEDMIEHQKEMEELEKCNREMKNEIGLLKEKMGKTDLDDCLREIADLKKVIREQELQICCLETQIARGGDIPKVNDHIKNLECEIEYLKQLNTKMRADLQEACSEIERCAELECLLEEEKLARAAAEALAKQGDSGKSTKLQKEEFNLEAKVSSTAKMNEVDALRREVEELNRLVEELKKENALLKERQEPCPDYLKEVEEKNALENLLALLQCELDTCRELQSRNDCKSLREELNRMQDQNCQLKSLVNCYKERLDLERCSSGGSGSLSPGVGAKDENHRLRSEITRLRCELITLCKQIEDGENKMCDQHEEIERMKNCIKSLLLKNSELEEGITAKENESMQLKEKVSQLTNETSKLASDNDVLKHRLMESESPDLDVPNEDYEQDLTEKHAIESTMRNLEEEVNELKKKLEECRKVELDKKRTDMEDEIEKLKKEKSEKSPSEMHDVTSSEAKKKEESLLREIAGMKEQSAKFQMEANEAKAENEKLKKDIDDLKKLLEKCNKEKTEGAAQAVLMSSKLQGSSYPVPAAPQTVSQMVIPKQEEQRAAIFERGKQGEAISPAGAKVAFVETAPAPELKVVVESKTVLSTPSKAPLTPSKAATLTPSKAPLTPSKAAMLTPSKAAMLTPSKAAMLTPSKAAMLTPSKAAMLTPSRLAALTPSKAAILTPSAIAMLTPSKLATLSPSKAEIIAKLKEQATTEGSAPIRSSGSDESIITFSELDPDFSKFLCTLNPENHKANICEIERRLKEKISELQKKNEEKVKKLIQQHEKEGKMRDKAYNDNVSTIKSGHESYVRDLTDRHKGSIIRLQSLHEDKINELNINYENQLRAMLTKNESIVNDLSNGAMEKLKMLAEQHNKDIKELEKRNQELIQKKEEEYASKLSSLKLNDENTDPQELYRRELKKIRRSNMKRVDIMQNKYEKLLTCERKKYEKQLEDMVQRLRQGKPIAHGICQCRMTAPCPRDPNAPLELNDVLQKILSEGLESLTFNEIALVHRRTCAATEDILLKPEVNSQLSPPIVDDSSTGNQFMKANKEELLNRIISLENEITIKQMETQKTIIDMERAVKAERQRLQELKDSIRHERKSSESKLRFSKTSLSEIGRDFHGTPVREQIMQQITELQARPPCSRVAAERDGGTPTSLTDTLPLNTIRKSHIEVQALKHKPAKKKTKK